MPFMVANQPLVSNWLDDRLPLRHCCRFVRCVEVSMAKLILGLDAGIYEKLDM
jgi:hypothetical protein